MLIVIRGVSGSGKTTAAQYVSDMYNGRHFEADQYFVDRHTGEYRFNPTKLQAAHMHCQRMTDMWLGEGQTVVVSNTGIRLWELETYFALARKHNVPVHVFRMTGTFQNVHGVPDDKVQKMRDNMVDIPGEHLVSCGEDIMNILNPAEE